MSTDSSTVESPRATLVGWALVAVLVVGLGAALWSSLATVEYAQGGDESFYLQYMREIGSKGFGAFPELFRTYVTERDMQNFPPPSRLGFIAVSALWSHLFGAEFDALSKLSLASHLTLIVLVFAFTKRWLGVHRGLLVTVLVAFSTLYLGLARRALTDSFISLTQFVAIACFVEYLLAPQRRRWATLFGIAFTFAILTKEIAVLLTLPLGACAAVERWVKRRPIPTAMTLIALIAPVFATIAVWVIAAWSPSTLYEQMHIVLLSPAGNAYAILFGSGGWYRYPVDEFLMSPWPTALGFAGVVLVLWWWRRGEYSTVTASMALVYLFQVGVLSFFTKNLRYVAVLEVPLRILAVVVLWEFFAAHKRLLGRWTATGVVALLCTFGWLDYRTIWLEAKVYDPVLTGILRARKMVPVNRALRDAKEE